MLLSPVVTGTEKRRAAPLRWRAAAGGAAEASAAVISRRVLQQTLQSADSSLMTVMPRRGLSWFGSERRYETPQLWPLSSQRKALHNTLKSKDYSKEG